MATPPPSAARRRDCGRPACARVGRCPADVRARPARRSHRPLPRHRPGRRQADPAFFDGTAVLFDGGPPEAGTARLLRRPGVRPLDLPDVDAMKVPHHRSADPGLPQVLERLRPELAAIEVGPNTYGHPTAQRSPPWIGPAYARTGS